MSDLARLLSWVGDWVAGEGRVLLMTDYDGTLTPIVDDPADAFLSEDTREQLLRIARSPRGSVSVISGRGVEDLRAMAHGCDLDELFVATYARSVSGVIERRRPIHPDTAEVWNWIVTEAD